MLRRFNRKRCILLKYIDKFLKFLKTDRNTFLTYILTLVSVYLLVDRLLEMLFLFFTGISVSYWGPIKYTLAMACPIFAFLFSGASSFAKSDNAKYSFVYLYVTALYIIGISMVSQWINQLLWLLFLSVPNYLEIVTDSYELIRPAFTAIAIYLPLVTFFGVIEFTYMKVNDSKLLRDSILDYGGLNLSPKPSGTGPYTCEIAICTDRHSGKVVKVPENKRFESMLVVGPSGMGKTSLIFEPMIARDLEKKYFFREVSKEMGFTALKTGLAILRAPYDNNYLNNNFSLTMLEPVESKLKLYKAYMKKLIIGENSNEIIYKNVGITSMSPDFETTSHMIDVAENFGISYNLIDPNNENSIGMNPFALDNASQTAVAISSVLKGMFKANNKDIEEAFKENVTYQAIENISILLKEMYPRLNDGKLPNLEDMLNMLTNFDLVEDICRKMEYDEVLSQKYKLLINYFKKNFYSTGSGRADTEKYVYGAVTQLDNLLRIKGVRNILCNRTNNINFDDVLSNGDVTFVCTRRGDLGATAHKAFGLFFIILMQYSVLRRPGNENNRVPNYLYIDEFPDFIGESTEPLFTLYRKYRVGTIISAQNLDQLGYNNNDKYKQTILSNCATKVVFGDGTPEDNAWWSKELGNKRKWKFGNSYDTAKGKYDDKLTGIVWDWTANFQPDKLRAMAFKGCAYETKTVTGKYAIGEGKLDFLESKYKEPHKGKTYNFTKFTNGVENSVTDDPRVNKSKKFDFKNVDFSDLDRSNEIDPIKMNTTDSSYLFDNEDAIIVNLKRPKK